MNATTRLVILGLLFLLKFIPGYWLSRSGKPYNVGISAIHKLISLATAAWIVVTVRYLRQGLPMGAVEVGALVVTGLFFLTAILTGGLLSVDRPAPAAVSAIHKVMPYLALLSTALTIYLVM